MKREGEGQWRYHTICFRDQLNDIPYPDIDDTKEPLVLFFELFLVKDLDGQYAVLVDFAT